MLTRCVVGVQHSTVRALLRTDFANKKASALANYD